MRFIRPCEVLRMIGVSRTTLWRMVRDGVFPPPIRITKRNTGYILDDVEGWIRQRAGRVPPLAAADAVAVAVPCAVDRAPLRNGTRARG